MARGTDCPGLTLRLSDDPCLHFSRCLLRLDNQMKGKKKKEQRACRRACLHPDELGAWTACWAGVFAGIAVWTRAGRMGISGCVVWYWSYQTGPQVVGSCKRGTGVVVEKDGTGGVPALELELELELKLGLGLGLPAMELATGSGTAEEQGSTHTHIHIHGAYTHKHTLTQTRVPKQGPRSDRSGAIGRSQIQ